MIYENIRKYSMYSPRKQRITSFILTTNQYTNQIWHYPTNSSNVERILRSDLY